MSEPVLYMRGFPQFNESIPDFLIDDLKEFLSLSEDTIENLCTDFGKETGFSTGREIRSLLERAGLDTPLCGSAFRVIRWSEHLKKTDTFDDAIENLAAISDKEGNPAFEPQDLKKLAERIDTLLRSATSIERQTKAIELGKATGQRLQEVKLVCDLRPVFNQERDSVEGVFPITTIRILTEGADGLPLSFEAVMSEAEVDKLCEIASQAKQKIAKLRELADQLQLPIPSIELTR